MTLIETLLSQTADGKKELKRQHLIVDITQKIWAAMEAEDVNKADLARLLGTSKSNVTQLLNGQRNMTLSSLADICVALQVEPEVTLRKAKSLRRFDVVVQMKQMPLNVEPTESPVAVSGMSSRAALGRITAERNITVGVPKVAQMVEA